MSLIPLIKSLVFKRTTYHFKLVAVILSLSKIMPTYSCYVEKGLVYIAIITPLSCQPSFYAKCTKLNIRSSYNVKSLSNVKCIFFTRSYIF